MHDIIIIVVMILMFEWKCTVTLNAIVRPASRHRIWYYHVHCSPGTVLQIDMI